MKEEKRARHFQRLGSQSPQGRALSIGSFADCKLWEGTDLLTVTLRGYPIIPHFRFHHYTTPLFAWAGLVSRSHHGVLFMILNLWMHAMVYTFHAGFQPAWLKGFIRRWQYVQLLSGIVSSLLALSARLLGAACVCEFSPAGGEWLPVLTDLVPALCFLLYYGLFLLELRDEEGESKKTS